MEKEQIIQLWKELKVTSVIFEYSCGGDSMNSTEIYIKTDEGNIESEELSSYFDNAVYDEVEFYVNSDGVYQGEYGNVYITLSDDETEFEYCKSSTEEWTESVSHEFEFEMTPKEESFLLKNVKEFTSDNDENNTWNFKRDFVLTPTVEKLLETFTRRLHDRCLEEMEKDKVSIDLIEEESSEWNGYYYVTIEEFSKNKLTVEVLYNFDVLKPQ